MAERLTITLETGNAAMAERYHAQNWLMKSLCQFDIDLNNDSGIIRDINGNKVGEWKWEPVEQETKPVSDWEEIQLSADHESDYSEKLEETFHRS